ncbi:disulfide bond formation protein B [Chitinimonas sp. BJB300]|uniref:disulfide bond formation protein B n=1 Tax=Chitinimonas sp. BJB300 TaxID=1559339 RepID=UPI000C0DE4E4|nr:disulfide bond formation protein B [Chitinimonas sp. BJB300]PHV13287.1 disulfide bond formation protein B [Chitinimonas sp. BJB300]TSJ86008.1 disulfide bond formation protein B [Chitinimonas sp. BJB300]
MSLLNRRVGYLAVFLACAGMMVFALYQQYYNYLNPCPMCIFQRVCVIAVGMVALLAAVHNPKSALGARIYGVLSTVAALAGFGIAARHAYIQTLPPSEVPACGPGLNFMLDSMPFADVLQRVLLGTGECAMVDWSLFGLSMPGWVAIACAGLAAACAFLGFKARR